MLKLDFTREVREHLEPLRRSGRRIAFVPTMGALHLGHRSLMRAARRDSDCLVVSIFVNPMQFGPSEDFALYPRPLEADLAACKEEGVDVAFCPALDELYPPGACTTVSVAGLAEGLCGRHRPGHFDGVTTVVAKLFNIVQPQVAFFGQKDAQQAVVVRRMVRDLCLPVEIVVCPTVREPDGLAMSSRNAYLTPEQRRQAVSLQSSLEWARGKIAAGDRDPAALVANMADKIKAAGPCSIDYIEIVDPEDLTPKTMVEGRCLIALAVRIGQCRLIDNILVDA